MVCMWFTPTDRHVLVLIYIHFSEAFTTKGHLSLLVMLPIFSFQDTTLSHLQHLWMLLSLFGHPSVSGKTLHVEFHEKLYTLSLGDLIHTQSFNYQLNIQTDKYVPLDSPICS